MSPRILWYPHMLMMHSSTPLQTPMVVCLVCVPVNLRRVEAGDTPATTADLHPVGPAFYALPRRDDCAACKKDLGCTHRPWGLGRGGPTTLQSCVAAPLSLDFGAALSPGRPHGHPSLQDLVVDQLSVLLLSIPFYSSFPFFRPFPCPISSLRTLS